MNKKEATKRVRVDAKIEGGDLVLRLPIMTEPVPSASGKTLVVATSRGNHRTDLVVNGAFVVVGVNAYIYKDD